MEIEIKNKIFNVEVVKYTKHSDVCVLTNMALQKHDDLYLIESQNNEYFPPCFVNKISADDIGLEETIKRVAGSYSQFESDYIPIRKNAWFQTKLRFDFNVDITRG